MLAWNWPCVQFVQLVEDVEEEKVLTGQDKQTDAEAAEYFPAAQLPVTADSPVVAQYEPAVQALHALSPADAAKVP